MDTEQSSADSEVALTDRLAAALAPEVDTPAPVTPEVESPMGDQPEEDEPAEAEAELVEFEDDDGAVYKIPAALKDKIPLRADYTRKTQQAATLVESAHDRLQYAEAREQFVGQVMQDVAEVKALQSQLKQYDGVDLSALYSSDPGTALRIRDQREDLRRQIHEKEQAINGKARQLDQMAESHSSKQWSLAVQGAKERIGQFTPGEDMAMLKQVSELGLTEKEIKGRYADPRILHAIYKAAKWDALQNSKGKSLETAQKAPPVVKPGAATNNAAASKEKALRSQLKKSGDYRDAARLLLLKGKL